MYLNKFESSQIILPIPNIPFKKNKKNHKEIMDQRIVVSTPLIKIHSLQLKILSLQSTAMNDVLILWTFKSPIKKAR